MKRRVAEPAISHRRDQTSPDDRGASLRPARRRFAASLAALAASGPTRAFAQPARAPVVRLVVGFAPGAFSDRVARVLAAGLAVQLGRPVIVENLAGANSGRAIARVEAGETGAELLLFATSAIAHPDHAAALNVLAPAIMTSSAPMMLVARADHPVHDPASFARWVRSHPHPAYASGGVGNATHLASAALMESLGVVGAIHVPYGGSPAGFADLVGGRVDFMMSGLTVAWTRHAGARVIATTGLEPSPLAGFESLPTLAGTIAPGFDVTLWHAIYLRARPGDPSIDAWNARFRQLLADDAMRRSLAEAGADVRSGSPADAEAILRAEIARFRRLAAR